nr:putative holin-like toxin [Lactobacillus gasseri]
MLLFGTFVLALLTYI